VVLDVSCRRAEAAAVNEMANHCCGVQRHCNYAAAICLGAYGMMVSTTLGHSAIHAADHLPDLESGPCAAGAAHRWDHPEDRAAVQ
jgi:hypothetical protein